MADPGPGPRPQTDAIIARYSGFARLAQAGGTPHDGNGCGDSCSDVTAYAAEDQVPEAALRASLGCGNPLAVADLRPGETVLDLGSGGGLDALLSARCVGPSGTVYGLDPDERTAAENRIGCAASTLTAEEYRHELRAAGFTGITITATSEAGEGLHTAIVRAAKPTG